MTDYSIKSTRAPRFSFARVLEFARYSLPQLRKQMSIYALASVVCTIICLIPGKEAMQVGLFVMTWTALPLIYYCTPIVFAKGADSRIINRLIPVSAGERLTFYYPYLLVVIPAILFIPTYIGSLIYRACPSLQTPGALELYRLKFMNMGILSLINLTGGILICTLCFLCVERARFNRLLWGIVAVIGGNFFLGVVGAVIAGTNAFQQGLKDGLEGNSPMNVNSKELLESTFATLSKPEPVTIAGLAVIAIMVVVVALLTYQTLKRRNL